MPIHPRPAHGAAHRAQVSGEPTANFPAELKKLEHWVCWKRVSAKPKPRKIPIDPKTGREAKSNDPTTWGTYDQALDRLTRDQSLAGVGFEFFHSAPYSGVDLDHCLDAGTGELSPVDLGNSRTLDPLEIIRRLDSYTELSPSGTGFHVIVKGRLPAGGRKKGGFECYDQGRFFTVTGRHWEDSPPTVEDRQAELEALHRDVFPKGNGQAKPEPSRSGPLPETDLELIEKACKARNGAQFAALWRGDTSGHGNDPSGADLALCNDLAFWTEGDAARMDSLFRQSGLMRPKWDQRRGEQTYGQRTIGKALEGWNGESYRGKRAQTKPEQRYSQGDGQKEKPVRDFHFTDTGNAERLVHHFGDRLRYCYRLKRWIGWSGSHWQIDEGAIVSRYAKATVKRIYREAGETEDEGRRKEVARHAMRCEAKQKRQAMIELAQSEEGIPVTIDDLDKNPWLLNVQNGTLNLRTGTLANHDPSHLITRVLGVAHDPKAHPTLWGNFLDRVTAGNEELIGFLRRAIGYSLTGNTREQCLFFMHGTGSNGKSVFVETLRALLGDFAQKTGIETIMSAKRNNGAAANNDVAILKGARCVITSEVQRNRRLNENLVKDLTGGDSITARFLFSEFFTFKPEFKLWVYGNHKPVVRGTDHGIWRRILLIPFTVEIPEAEKDKDLAEKLRAELPGILAWAVRGCLEWQRDGLNPPAIVAEATKEYREEMDVLAAFLGECCVIRRNAKASAKDLYHRFCAWGEENGERAESQRSFGLRLAERGFARVKWGSGWQWQGIGLSDPSDPSDPISNSPPEEKYYSDRHRNQGHQGSHRSLNSQGDDDKEVI